MSNKKKRPGQSSSRSVGSRSGRRTSNFRKRLIWLAILAIGLVLLVVPSVVTALGK